MMDKVNVYWQLFMTTGSPEAYLLFRQTQETEKTYVSDHPGGGSAGHGVS